MKKALLPALLSLTLMACEGPGATRMLAIVSKPPPPCEIRIFLDAHTEYDIDITEARRVLEENGRPCPYILDITIWDQAELDQVLLRKGRVSIAKCVVFTNGHHIIYAYLIDDFQFKETPNRDFSVVNSLSEAEWGTWSILHELGHMIWDGKGWDYSDATELWCDTFANENYSQYSIVIEEGSK